VGDTLQFGVYRRLDNRAEGRSDDSPRALELHDRRKMALHEALEGVDVWSITSWGDTDHSRPHEFVELFLALAASAQFKALAVPALTFVGGLLVKEGVKAATAEAVKTLIARLRPKQQEKKILDFLIRLPDGTHIRCDPEASDVRITVDVKGGKSYTVQYSASEADIARLRAPR
jgi:hypothetical protein